MATEPVSDAERLQRARTVLAHRLAHQGAWWQRIGRGKIEQQDSDGRTCVEHGRRLIALSGIIRSARYADLFDAVFLEYVARKPALTVAKMITARLPDGRIPGYSER